jgi:ankyrin repeat protein
MKLNRNYLLLVLILLSSCKALEATKYLRACETGDLSKVQWWAETKKGDVNYAAKDIRINCLMFASGGGHLEIVKYLLAQGANVEAKDKQGRTPLIWAAMRGQLEVVKALLEAGADINKTSMFGATPLEYAGKYNHQQVIDFLKSKGATEEVISHKIND